MIFRTTLFKRRIIFTLLIICYSFIAQAQDNKEKAYKKGMEAVRLFDKGKLDESIKLLKEAQRLDPGNTEYSYDIAYVYFISEEFDESVEILESLRKLEELNEKAYLLLGNSYRRLSQEQKAAEAYDEGIKRFPTEGRLYLERANLDLAKEEYYTALKYLEKGIEMDPKFPSNYYWASKVYFGSSEPFWGILYGEIFMNLENNSPRTAEIGRLIFKAYKREIRFDDTCVTVGFNQRTEIHILSVNDSQLLRFPFGMIFAPVMQEALHSEKQTDIHSLNRARIAFIQIYYEKEYDRSYPNILYDYHYLMLQENKLEAYNYWLLRHADQEAFAAWLAENQEKWTSFKTWLTDNPLRIDQYHKFYRGQY